jgi:signal-transduction protein with cAMP-binding, CBS, and nucleotidyltransferase domain
MDLFKGLSKEDLGKIVDAVEEKNFKDGQYVFRQGDLGHDFFIISKGSVVVAKSLTSGAEETVVTQLDAGKFFGELALSMNKPRAASVFAKGDCSCFTLDRGAFERLLGPVSEVLGREKLSYAHQDIANLKEEVQKLKAELASVKSSSVSFCPSLVLNDHASFQIESLLQEPLAIEIPVGISDALQKSLQVLKSNYADSQMQLKLLVERMNGCRHACASFSSMLSK